MNSKSGKPDKNEGRGKYMRRKCYGEEKKN